VNCSNLDEVGKQWSFVTDYVFNDPIFGILQGRGKVSAAGLGYEKVRAPAGEFDAFKLETKSNWVSPNNPLAASPTLRIGTPPRCARS
jgi:hypothetical protein